MNDFIVNNDFFRVIYCLLVDSDATCSAVGYSGGILPTWLAFVIAAAVVGGVIVTTVLLMVLALIWAERRILARFQGRTGPNRWGPFGLLTPIADTIKLLFKEEITPRDAQRFFFTLAPIIGMVAVLLVFAFIPFGEGIFVTDLNVGLVFLLAVTSLSALSVLIAGWVSGKPGRYLLIAARDSRPDQLRDTRRAESGGDRPNSRLTIVGGHSRGAERAVHHSPAVGVSDIRDDHPGRDQPDSVRPDRGRV